MQVIGKKVWLFQYPIARLCLCDTEPQMSKAAYVLRNVIPTETVHWDVFYFMMKRMVTLEMCVFAKTLRNEQLYSVRFHNRHQKITFAVFE